MCDTHGTPSDSPRVVGDDELLYRRIPPGETWFEPPDRLTTANFKLKQRELGLSVYRRNFVSADKVLQAARAVPGSRLANAVAGDVRALTNANGEPLHLNVIPVDEADDPGHAEIRGPAPGKLTRAMSKALRDLFKLVESTP